MLPLRRFPWFFERIHGDLGQPSLVQKEVAYGQILLAGGLFSLLGRLSHNCFFGLQRPKVVTVSALVGNLTNLAASYALIFGESGLPALGLPGILANTTWCCGSGMGHGRIHCGSHHSNDRPIHGQDQSQL